jgi:dTDP-4-dehydrorhamnose reductase
MSQPILGTGLNGLVGSKLVTDFDQAYAFETLDISDPANPIDITDYDQVVSSFIRSSAEFVVHMAAFTNVTAAWEQRDDKSGPAYQVNVVGTENIVKACQETGKHLIHISTAYVFNGEKEGMYQENDARSPIEWYGQTKAWAEEVVETAEISWTILRIDQPFRSDPFPREDIAHRIINGLQSGSLYPQFTNHYFGPTFIDDFARVIDWVIRTKTRGLFHASSGERWSDYDFAQLINSQLKLSGQVEKGDLDQYLQTLNRPYQRNTSLDCSKLYQALDFKPHSVEEAVGLIKL